MQTKWCFPVGLVVAFVAVQPPAAADSTPVTIAVASDHIDFLAGKDLVARYQFAAAADAPLAKPYLWPLYGPGGTPMTRDWPIKKGTPGESSDHVHQKSVWFCHGDVIPEGLEIKNKPKNVAGVDFWSEGKGHGRIVCRQHAEPTAEVGVPDIVRHIDRHSERATLCARQAKLGHPPVSQPAELAEAEFGEPD